MMRESGIQVEKKSSEGLSVMQGRKREDRNEENVEQNLNVG